MEYQKLPSNTNPADYGSDANGNYYQDGIVDTDIFTVATDRGITTHTHGLVIYASREIVIDGTLDVMGKGVANEAGYDLTNRVQALAIHSQYGIPNVDGTDYLLYGGSANCDAYGGGYVILHAPAITIHGEINAGPTAACAAGGIVYLETNSLNVDGRIISGLTISRSVI